MTGEIFDSTELAEVREAIDDLGAQADKTIALLGRIDAAMDAIRGAGMYENAPARESWESKNTSGPIYLYLYWRKDREGGYLGPDGKRKLYIGNDPGKIAEARRKVENQQLYLALQGARRRVALWLCDLGGMLDSWQRQAGQAVGEAEGFTQDYRELAKPADVGPILARTCEEVKSRVGVEQASERLDYPSE